MSLYKNESDKLVDIVTANSVKVFSENRDGVLVPASDLERQLHNEDRAAAATRLAIDKAMASSAGA